MASISTRRSASAREATPIIVIGLVGSMPWAAATRIAPSMNAPSFSSLRSTSVGAALPSGCSGPPPSTRTGCHTVWVGSPQRSTVGVTTQAEALIGLGIEDRLRTVQVDSATTLEAYAELRAALQRLLDPGAMGRFRVMAFGRAWPDADDPSTEPLGLFRFRLPRRSTD